MNKATADLVAEIAKLKLRVEKVEAAIGQMVDIAEALATETSHADGWTKAECRVCGFPPGHHVQDCPLDKFLQLAESFKR
jgi:hypothetical protein